MKELNNFRKFLKEDLDEGMFDKFKKELGDVVKAYKELEKAATSGGDGSSRATKDRQLKADAKKAGVDFKEEQVNEGTWALGSVAEMLKVMAKLEQIRKMGAAKGSIELENMDTALYNVFGDDEFSDAIDAAKGTDDDDRFNNFIGDAQARARELYEDEVEYRKERGETGMEFKPRFGLEENDDVLDEVIEAKYMSQMKSDTDKLDQMDFDEPIEEAPMQGSMGIFKEIDEMVGSIKDQMNPDDAFDSLVSEFEAISGGTKLLHRALKNIALDNNL